MYSLHIILEILSLLSLLFIIWGYYQDKNIGKKLEKNKTVEEAKTTLKGYRLGLTIRIIILVIGLFSYTVVKFLW